LIIYFRGQIHIEHNAPTVLPELAARPTPTSSVSQGTVTSNTTNDKPKKQSKGKSLLLPKQEVKHANDIVSQDQGSDSQLFYLTYQTPNSNQSIIDDVDSIIVVSSTAWIWLPHSLYPTEFTNYLA
jgi:hypothetical protein